VFLHARTRRRSEVDDDVAARDPNGPLRGVAEKAQSGKQQDQQPELARTEAAAPRAERAGRKQRQDDDRHHREAEGGAELGAFETPDQVAGLVRKALEHIPAERLILGSDCGMGREGMSRRHAFYKMVSIVQGTNLVRRERKLPEAACLAADEKFSMVEETK